MKVYAVCSGEYSDWGIDAVFSTKKKAQDYIRANSYCYDKFFEPYSIISYDIDQPIFNVLAVVNNEEEIHIDFIKEYVKNDFTKKEIIAGLFPDLYYKTIDFFNFDGEPLPDIIYSIKFPISPRSK